MADRVLHHLGPLSGLPQVLAAAHARSDVGDQWRFGFPADGFDPEPDLGPGPEPGDLLVGAGFDSIARQDREQDRVVDLMADEAGRRPVGRAPRPGVVYTAERAWSVPDRVAPAMTALVIGLNPSPVAADTGVGYGRPGNRFWPAALASGLVSVDRDPDHALAHHGVGFTSMVKRTTRAASELSNDEFRAGRGRLERLIGWLRPDRVIVLGLGGWRVAVDRHAKAGWQDEPFADRPVYLMPNPSGLNAHTTLDGFVEHFRTAQGSTPG